MTTTRTAPRYRLLTRYGRTMAQVQDTGHVDFGIRGRSTTVTALLDIDEARDIMARLEATHRATR
jgi:hypothetical protein